MVLVVVVVAVVVVVVILMVVVMAIAVVVMVVLSVRRRHRWYHGSLRLVRSYNISAMQSKQLVLNLISAATTPQSLKNTCI